MTAMAFGPRIRELRIAKGWTQTDVAKKIKVSTSAVGMYEQGRREPSISIMIDFSKIFETSVDYLLNVQNMNLAGADTQKDVKVTDLGKAIERFVNCNLTWSGKLLNLQQKQKLIAAFKAVAEII